MSVEQRTAPGNRVIDWITASADYLARYSLIIVIAGFGAVKFTSYEAYAIQPLVANSPFMAWTYDIVSVRTFSSILGVVELTTAALLPIKPWAPKLSVIGSVFAIGLFVATLSFLFTTPGVTEATAGGFPALSATGAFLIKDIALLGFCVWTLGDALQTARNSGGHQTRT
jgi:uncharacterized membrane protein YkgB